MKNINLLYVFAFGISFINAQNDNVQIRDIKNHPDFIRYLQYGKTLPTKAIQVQKSEYYGLDNVLTKFFYYDQIPLDFPKANENISREEYIKEINNWLSLNQQRIKPEKQNRYINLNGEEYEKD